MRPESEIDINTVGGRIRQIRKTLGLKGKEFVERIKISGPSLSEIEKGKYDPNFDLITNLARAYHVNLYYLVFGEGSMFVEPGKMGGHSTLEKLSEENVDIRRFLHYFEKSEIIRYFVMSQFKSKLITEIELIEKEIARNSQELLKNEGKREDKT